FEYDKDDEIFNKNDEYLSDDEDLFDNMNLFSHILEKIKTEMCVMLLPLILTGTKTASELKSMIQTTKHNDFAGIDSDRLKLWQTEISDANYDELVNFQIHDNDASLDPVFLDNYIPNNVGQHNMLTALQQTNICTPCKKENKQIFHQRAS
ncbi:11243_t:CDS:2, partial [Racocetra fulgida]